MRRRSPLWLIGLLLLGPGCTLVRDATSLAVFKVRESAEDFSETIRNRRWAEHAWADVQNAKTDAAYSEDYAQGFKDGFAHYLFRGGNGEPPPLPPRRYRGLRYQTPQGYQAIEDWFAGFRHGADLARHNGYRQWITGPSALRGPNPLPPLPVPGPSQAIPAPYPLFEELPPPVPISPGVADQPVSGPPSASTALTRPGVLTIGFQFTLDPPAWLMGGHAEP
jgi:hypothetical protein